MKLLRYKDLKPGKGIPWTRQYIDKLVKAGKFPKPFNLGPNTKVWTEEVIDTYIAERAEAAQ